MSSIVLAFSFLQCTTSRHFYWPVASIFFGTIQIGKVHGDAESQIIHSRGHENRIL